MSLETVCVDTPVTAWLGLFLLNSNKPDYAYDTQKRSHHRGTL